MEIHDLEQELRDDTLCEIKNIKIKKIDGKLTILIDEFLISESETEGMYDVSDTKDTFDVFETTPKNVVIFFKGFYDAFAGDKEDDETDQYYTLGFDFGTEAFEKSLEDVDDND